MTQNPQSSDRDCLRLIQVTDCHLGAEPGEQLLGMDTDESLLDVLALLRSTEAQADMLVASGDIASAGAEPAYGRFLDYLDDYLDLPAAWLAGNHDLPQTMKAIEPGRIQSDYVELGDWQLILLDSSVLGSEGGSLSAAELQRLTDLLQTSKRHTLVFVHHQPVPMKCDWLDKYVIDNADQFFAALQGHEQVKAVVFGHVHQEFDEQHQGIRLLASPSTCIQFKPRLVDFAVDRKMPGYRWFNLYGDGSFETEIVRIPEKDYGVDYDSPGY